MAQKKGRSADPRPLACVSVAQNQSKAPVLHDTIFMGFLLLLENLSPVW